MKYLLLLCRFCIVVFQKILSLVTLGHFPPPFVSAVAVIQEGENVLLIDRKDGLGLGFPGGFVGLYEKTEDAARREVKEETGLDVEIKDVLTVISGKRRGTKISSTDIVYHAVVIGNNETRDSFEGACKWIAIREADNYKIALDYDDVLKLL